MILLQGRLEQNGKVLSLDSVIYNGGRGRQGKTLENSVLHQVSGITPFPQKGQCHLPLTLAIFLIILSLIGVVQDQ